MPDGPLGWTAILSAAATEVFEEGLRLPVMRLRTAEGPDEVLEQIKSDPELRSIPVVVLTSSREERDIVESYRLGVNSYIVKPVDFAQFTEAVRNLGLYWILMNQPPSL